jgi:hypothetical protein
LTSIISDIAKVPFFPPKIQVQYFLKFFRTKGDYKSKLARNFEGRRHFAAEVVVKRGSFKYLKIFFF